MAWPISNGFATGQVNPATGGLAFTFQPISQGNEAQASFCVPGSATFLQWNVLINGQLKGTMFGAAFAGPFFMSAQDTAVIEYAGLVQLSPQAGNILGAATMQGLLGNAGELGPVVPSQGGGTPGPFPALYESGVPITLTPAAIPGAVYPSSAARGIIVYAEQLPILPPPGCGVYVPITTDAIAIESGVPPGVLGGWFLSTPPNQPIQVEFAAPTVCFIYETDADEDYIDLARSLPNWAVTVPNPGFGADWSYTLLAPARVKVVNATFVASGVAGNRYPKLFVSGGYVQNAGLYPAALTAGDESVLVASPGASLSQVTAAGVLWNTAPIPDLLLPTGVTIQSNTSGLLAGDEWIDISLVLEYGA